MEEQISIFRKQLKEIDESQQDLIHDAYAAQCADVDLIVNNCGYIYDYKMLLDLTQKCRHILKVVSSITGNFDTHEYNNWVELVNNERIRRLDEEDAAFSRKRKAEKKAANMSTFIYLMKNERSGHYKIGISKKPKHREVTLQAEDPHVTLMIAYKGIKPDERQLHKLFAEKRTRGEWFTLTDEDVAQFHAYFNDNRSE